MRSKILKIILLAVFVLNALTLEAADKKKNFFTNFGVGARAMVFKSSFVAVSEDYLAGQRNPAGVGFSRNIFVGMSHARIAFNRQVGFVSVVLPVDRNDKFGVFWKGFLINDIEARSSNTAQSDYLFNNVEQMVGLTYARRIGGSLALGFSANLLRQTLDEHYASGWGVDFGFIYRLGEKLSVGASLNDFREKLAWETGHADHFEKVGSVGVSYELAPGALVAVGYRSKNIISAGTEVKISSPLRLRMGWQENQLALGVGLVQELRNMVFSLNYAVLNHQLSNELSHVFDVTISFKSKAKHSPPRAIVKVGQLNIRSGPGVNFPVVAVAKKGQQFIVLAEYGGWVKIKLKRRRIGWIGRKYVKITNYFQQ